MGELLIDLSGNRNCIRNNCKYWMMQPQLGDYIGLTLGNYRHTSQTLSNYIGSILGNYIGPTIGNYIVSTLGNYIGPILGNYISPTLIRQLYWSLIRLCCIETLFNTFFHRDMYGPFVV